MKVTYRNLDGFVKSPPPGIRAVLVYGPDDGLMRERAALLCRTVVADINDPFNVSVLTSDLITDDPGRLSSEANAISMMGGRRLVRIEDARDAIAPQVRDYLADPNDNALLVLEAGDLNPRSALRKLFEKAENAAALPCYVEDERDIAGLIRSSMQEAGIKIAPDAVAWLASHIVGDRQRARREIEKLITYMGTEKQVALADVQDCCGSAGEQSYDDLVFSAAGRRAEAAFRAFSHMLEQGVPAVAILRALQNHFRRLHMARAVFETGTPPDQAMKSLSPPVFFKQEQDFREQLTRWDMPALEKILQRLFLLEAQCKQTATPAETLCSQALLAISCR